MIGSTKTSPPFLRRITELQGFLESCRICLCGDLLSLDAGSSFIPELFAIARTLSILAENWDIVIYTDSLSSINKIESELHSPKNNFRSPGRQLINIICDRIATRTGTCTLRHVKSHTNKTDFASVGNATADLLADHFRTHNYEDPSPPFFSLTEGPISVCQNTAPKHPIHFDIKKAISKNIFLDNLNTWIESKTQGHILRADADPLQLVTVAKKTLKPFKRNNTLPGLLTGSCAQTAKSGRFKDTLPPCRYCSISKTNYTDPRTETHTLTCQTP